MKLVITGAPRTKKNSTRRLMRGGRLLTVPSVAAVEWQAEAIRQLCKQYAILRHRARDTRDCRITEDVAVAALIYREANVGDLVGYLQAIGDALQGGHGKSKVPCVLIDDKQIKSWDGSRPLIDRKNPRVELTITPAESKEE